MYRLLQCKFCKDCYKQEDFFDRIMIQITENFITAINIAIFILQSKSL
jgi:hypothetical protein